jgi:hypothetical protein
MVVAQKTLKIPNRIKFLSFIARRQKAMGKSRHGNCGIDACGFQMRDTAEYNSALQRRPVPQILNPPYRRIVFGKALA